MIQKLYFYVSRNHNPYRNLAIEEYLTFDIIEDALCLYIWRNENTIVLGRNQNVYKECNLEACAKDNVRIARRLSGGGAVYHDLGNLNFTFITHKKDADALKQMQVILDAVKAFGIDASLSGRNDALVDGRKFSGNAFFSKKDRYYHHGTILIDVDQTKMQTVLAPSKAKLSAKGVDSVRSRTVNLATLSAALNVESLYNELLLSFQDVYNLPVEYLDYTLFDYDKIDELEQKYASKTWIYGKNIAFTSKIQQRLSFGEVELCFYVENNLIQEALFSTDALEVDWFIDIGDCLKGCKYHQDDINTVLYQALKERNMPRDLIYEINQFIADEL